MKTEILIKKEIDRRMAKFKNSKLPIILIVILVLVLTSCSTGKCARAYQITNGDQTYFVNEYTIVNDTIYGQELKRRGTIVNEWFLPYGTSQIVETK